MRIQMEYHKNPASATLHVNVRVQDEGYIHWNSASAEKEKQPDWVQELFKVNGVAGVGLAMYRVCIDRGIVVPWKEIIPSVVAIVENALDGQETLTVLPVIGGNLIEHDFQIDSQVDLWRIIP